MNLKNYWLHFKNTCKHKWWVFYYSWYFGIPIRGFFHDFSKFHPVEFFESARFFKGDSSPINEAKRINGISFAWQHHKACNPHHYEYWTDCYDTGTVPRIMPWKYVLELVCDYLAAGRTYNDYNKTEKFTLKKELDWWNNCKDGKCIHPLTKKLISAILENIACHGLHMFTKCSDNLNNAEISTRTLIKVLKEIDFNYYDYFQKHQVEYREAKDIQRVEW
jgi:hypothetical protein